MSDYVDPEGFDKKPWADRKRAVPLRTYSGTIKYKKRQKGWTEKDLLRVLQKIEPPATDPAGFFKRIWRAYVELIKKWLTWVFSLWAGFLDAEWIKTELLSFSFIIVDALAEASLTAIRQTVAGFQQRGEMQKVGIELMRKVGSAFGVSWKIL